MSRRRENRRYGDAQTKKRKRRKNQGGGDVMVRGVKKKRGGGGVRLTLKGTNLTEEEGN